MENYSPTAAFLEEFGLNEEWDSEQKLRYIFKGSTLHHSPCCMIVDPVNSNGKNKIALARQLMLDGVAEEYTEEEQQQVINENGPVTVFFGWVPTEQALRDVIAYTKWLD